MALQSNLQVADSETVEEAMGLEAVGLVDLGVMVDSGVVREMKAAGLEQG